LGLFKKLVDQKVGYLFSKQPTISLEGEEWEEIFANCIKAKWKPSNVGLDDVILKGCAWGAKTVKANKPSEQKTIRLISGRNSPGYSYGEKKILGEDPNKLGEQVLSIWNERVSAIRKRYKHVRTIVLIKSKNLEEIAVFEFDTIRYEPELYKWKWNKNKNLEGFEKASNAHRFTWQPHGSQFTIVENVPNDGLIVKIKTPKRLNKDTVLKGVGFNKNWVTVIKKNGG